MPSSFPAEYYLMQRVWIIYKADTWWHHQMETFSASLARWEGNPPVTGGFSSQRPVTRSFAVFFDVRLNKRLSKQSRCQCFKTPCRHREELTFEAVPCFRLITITKYSCVTGIVYVEGLSAAKNIIIRQWRVLDYQHVQGCLDATTGKDIGNNLKMWRRHQIYNKPQQTAVHEAHMCLAVLYLSIIWVHIGFVSVYFEFTLLSSTWWTQNGFKSAHCEHKKSWTHASTNLPETNCIFSQSKE